MGAARPFLFAVRFPIFSSACVLCGVVSRLCSVR